MRNRLEWCCVDCDHVRHDGGYILGHRMVGKGQAPMTDTVDVGVPLEARFWSKVDVKSKGQCWPWLGGTSRSPRSGPYGTFRHPSGKMTRAHRMSFELVNGPIPDGLVIRHTCDNPICCNPNHLIAGTQLDNVRDRDIRGRGWIPKGEAHGNSKLVTSQVIDIRRRNSQGESQRSLAREFGVSQHCIYSVINGGWSHV